jgi:DNA polymerase-3 subunit gamma/tau
MSQALYRKWRPARFDEVIGQDHVTRTLHNSVSAGRVGHAYLLCGPRGTGKTTTARLIAKAVNCLYEDKAQRPCNTCAACIAVNEARFLDLIEIDAASNTGVDDIRDLRDKINFSPSEGRLKVYIIDEVHMLSPAAFNALLKTLEEPPPHAMFVLATTEEHKVPLTIKSRCQQFNFRLLTDSEIRGRLEWLAEKESLELEPGAVALIARQAAGSLRDAESFLDQLIAAPGDTVTQERVRMVLGTATDAAVAKLTDAWLEGDGASGLDMIHDALASGTDPRQFSRQMVAYLRQLLLLQAGGPDVELDGPLERKAEMLAQARRSPRSGLIEAIKGFNEAALTPSGSWQPQLPLELAFIELLPKAPKPPAEPKRADQEIPSVPQKRVAEPPAGDEPPALASEASIPEDAPAEPAEEMAPQVARVSQAEEDSSDQPLTLTLVKSRWRDMLAAVGQSNKNLPPLLNMGKPLAVEGNTLVLGFDYPIFKEKYDNTAEAPQLIGDAFSKVLKVKCNVRGVVTSEYPIVVTKEEFHAVADELGGVVSEDKET